MNPKVLLLNPKILGVNPKVLAINPEVLGVYPRVCFCRQQPIHSHINKGNKKERGTSHLAPSFSYLPRLAKSTNRNLSNL